MVVNYTYCGGHFTIYSNIKSLHSILMTNTMLYVCYSSIEKERKKEETVIVSLFLSLESNF